MIAKTANLIALLLWFQATTTAESTSQFIWLSDLHFDPTANSKLVDILADASVDGWPGILESSPPAKFSGFGEDTNWALLSSALDAIRKTAPNAKFTVVTGDNLVHKFREKFQATAKNHDDESFRRFTTKTMQFIAAQLGTIGPGKPVLLTLGNNDSDCGDYQLQPHGAFLKDESGSIAKLLGPVANEMSTDDWTTLGSYSVPLTVVKHHRVISVNSVYFSARYRNACSADSANPAIEELHWLASKLAEAKDHKNKVWLIFHIPPGIDGYATSHPKAGMAQTIPMWKPVYNEEFVKLLSRYHDTVSISLAGHEHTDDFRLIANSLVLMTPALSPVVKQNPAFRVVSFRSDGTLSDATTYYLSNLDNVLNGAAPEWKSEYSFARTWQVRQLDFKNFSKLYHDIETNPIARDRWSALYSVSHPAGNTITRRTFPQLFCATGNITKASFETCVERIEGKP